MLDVLIEQRTGLDRGASNPTLTGKTIRCLIGPRPRSNYGRRYLFRFGDPIHVYKIKAVDGILQDERGNRRPRFSSAK